MRSTWRGPAWAVTGILGFAMAAGTARAADPHPREAALALLRELVAVDTSAGSGRVPAVARDLANRFIGAGFPAGDVHVVAVKDTAALVVRYRGRAGGARPIDLLAHLDVVPARTEEWGRDPFRLVLENGDLIGRGTLDVKGEVALLVTTLLTLRAEGFVPSRDLILVLTGDEETTGETAEALVNEHRGLVDAEFALNADNLGGGTLDETDGRPLLFRVQGSEKASARYRIETRNPGGHSSEPRADNAIYELATALEAVRRYRFPYRWNEWTLGDFAGSADSVPADLGAALRRFAAHPGDPVAGERIAAEPAFVGRLGTTCVATMLDGGHASNALPQRAGATLSCRLFPGDTLESVHATLQQVVGPSVAVIDGPPVDMPAASPLRADVMAAVGRAVEATHPGARVIPTQSSYATDGATFRLAGIPTYGVGGLFIRQSAMYAHGLNERIPRASFEAGLDYWRVLILALASSDKAQSTGRAPSTSVSTAGSMPTR